MTESLQPGAVRLGRFVLARRLRATGSSELWLAEDRNLETNVLLRVYLSRGLREDGAVDRIKREARSARRIRHPHAIRAHDLHEDGDDLVMSLEAHEDELLTASEPMPYRTLVEQIRPVIEVLADMHEAGGEHGHLDLGHVLVDGDAQWRLLPADTTQSRRGDMEAAGHLMAALLTGGADPADGSPLNDAAERLHAGRTVPALLDQLVSDLRLRHEAWRPTGMREILRRLDQIGAYVDGPDATPAPAKIETAPVAPAPPVAVGAPAPRGRGRWAWLIVPLLLLIVAGVMLRPSGRDAPTEAPTESEGDDTPVVVVPASETPGDSGAAKQPEPSAPVVDAAKVAEAKRGAEMALSRYLGARNEVDQIGGSVWGGAPYADGIARGAEADRDFLENAFDDAREGYVAAATSLEGVASGREDALVRLLTEGAEALAAPAAARATIAFEHALLIEPNHEVARIGLARASTLDELLRILEQGRAHENQGNLAFAHADYTAAVALDPHAPEAAEALRRVKDELSESQFQAMMSRGMLAYHDGHFAEARTHFLDAQRFRPEAEAAASALRMVAEAETLARIERLSASARALEDDERWQEAWNDYREVLAIDADVEAAQTGKARCEELITLHKQARQFLDDPGLLLKKGAREDATMLVATIGELPSRGPRMRQVYFDLSEQVRLASTPLRVSLESDAATEVSVYRFGRLGTFDVREVELLPGEHTIVGSRKGFKDVRIKLRLAPGERGRSVRVVCTERIG